MRKKTKRFLASLLAVLIMMSPLCTNAYADDVAAGDELQAEQPEGGAEPTVYSGSDDTVADDTVADNTLVDDTVVDDTLVDDTIVDDTLVDDTIVDDTIVDDTLVDDTLVDDTIVDDTIVDDTLVDDTLVDDTIVDDTLVDDTVVDDTVVDDTVVDDTLVDDTVTGSTASDDTMVIFSFSPLSDETDGDTPSAYGRMPLGENAVTPVITIGETQLDGTATDGGWSSESKSGWRYDGTSVSMVNAGGADGGIKVHAENSGIDLSLAGFNRISTLYADGDVNITGTGILLIDEIDMLSGSNLNLQTNTGVYTDGSGSVAVFLLDKATGEYNLINGSVAGILDDNYTIPDGVKLVVPDGGTLDMRITTEVTTTTIKTPVSENGSAAGDPIVTTVTTPGFTEDDYNNSRLFTYPDESGEIIDGKGYDVTTSKSAAFFTPVLNIASNAVLHLKEGAKLLVDAFKNSIFADHPQYGEVNVSGTLQLDGNVKTYSDSNDGAANTFVLNVESGGSVTGDGTISDAAVFYKEGAGKNDTLKLSGTSYLNLDSSGIDSLSCGGNTSIIYADGVSIGSVAAGGSANITFYGKDVDGRINITGSLTGAYTVSSGYLSAGGSFANEAFTNIKTNQASIPTLTRDMVDGGSESATDFYNKYIYGSNSSKNYEKYKDKWTEGSYSGAINFADMKSLIGNYELFEVFSYDGQNVTLHLFSKDSPPETVDRTQVFLIRGFNYALIPTSELGGGITTPGAANTGSGVLGGANAGSFTGGASNSVLGGDRQPPAGGGTEGGNTEGGGTEGGGTESGGTESGSGSGSENGSGSGSESGGGNNNFVGGDAGADSSVPAGSFVVEVSEAEEGYSVSAYLDGVALESMDGGTVQVAVKVSLSSDWNADELFAVFYGDNGELIAVKAFFDPATGMLTFESPLLGQFSLVCFHWDGSDYESADFLSALQAHMSK